MVRPVASFANPATNRYKPTAVIVAFFGVRAVYYAHTKLVFLTWESTHEK